MVEDKKKFDKIIRDIKSVKIQGATNIAKAALEAYFLFPGKKSKEIILKSRPTEPMVAHLLELAEKNSLKKIMWHFSETQDKINAQVFKLIKKGDVIFTHCHSTNVVQSLIYTKNEGKNFEIYNTETRPLFQGRRTAQELRKAKIKVTIFVDSAIAFAIEKENKKDRIYANKVFLGADALVKDGIINKIGSGMISELANNHNIPVYIIADSWKFTPQRIPLENRPLNEIWDKAPKNVKIKNPAFEFVSKKYIKGIITEFGLMSYSDFVREMSK